MPRLDREAHRALDTARYMERSLALCVESPEVMRRRTGLTLAMAQLEGVVAEIVKNRADLRAAQKDCDQAQQKLSECCRGVAHLLDAGEDSEIRLGSHPQVAAKFLLEALAKRPDARGALALFERFLASIDKVEERRRSVKTEARALFKRELMTRLKVTQLAAEAALHIRMNEPEDSRARKHLAKRFDRHSKRKAKPQP